jgi:hypothetical protein
MDIDHFSSTHRMRYTQLNVRYNWNMDVQSGRDTSCESANQVTWHIKVMSYNPCPVMRCQSESQSEHEAPLDDQLWLIE